jgi:ATP-dependent Clp protease ATP-binding subunit ClpA
MIAFGALAQETVLRVVDKFVLELSAQLGARDVTLQITPTLRAWLGEKGYKPEFGAREMGRVVQDELKKPLADELLFGRLMKGGSVLADLDDGKVVFTIAGPAPTVPLAPDPAAGGEGAARDADAPGPSAPPAKAPTAK